MNEMIKEQFLDLYDRVYQGKAWYGRNIMDTMSHIPVSKRCLRINGSYNMVELLHHMLAWRSYTVHVLEQNEHYHVSDDVNFPKIDQISEVGWKQLQNLLSESQSKMEAALKNFTRNWDDQIPQSDYTVLNLVFGVIHHDVYHLGQINFMAKFLI